jgi:DNA-binding protein HU-beta
MTKAELISLIAKSTGVEKAETLSVVTAYMEAIKKSLEEGENVYLRGFGSFIIKKRAEKKARNISKSTTITIPEHNIPAFKPAKVFMEAISSNKKKAAKKKK